MFTGLTIKASYVESLNFFYWSVGFAIPALICLFIIAEWVGREQNYALERLGINWPKPLRLMLYYSIIFAVLFWGGSKQEFIYFQF